MGVPETVRVNTLLDAHGSRQAAQQCANVLAGDPVGLEYSIVVMTCFFL